MFEELIAACLDNKLLPNSERFQITYLLPTGEEEAAEDTGGVLRDCLTEFWTTFSNVCTAGTDCKVPTLRHDFEAQHWAAIATVLSLGWTLEKYFPIFLCKSFITACLSLEEATAADITEDYFNYLSLIERQTLQAALEDIDSVPDEELLEVLSNHEVRMVTTNENIRLIVEQLAHKELIQCPMFVINCWKPLLTGLRLTKEGLDNLYAQLKPDARKVLKLLKKPEGMNRDSEVTYGHLLRFIRDCDMPMLKAFLRFCTGSDLVLGQSIEVCFVDLNGFERRPVAHTCGCVLELPMMYENYLAFKSEFHSVLMSGIWIMDIV